MRKLILGSLVATLLTGCSGASNVSQSSTLDGEWICHTIPTKDKQTYDRLDHFVLKSDGTGMLRGISSIELDKESTIRYLTKGKVKWVAQNNVLILSIVLWYRLIVKMWLKSSSKIKPYKNKKKKSWLHFIVNLPIIQICQLS